MQLARLLPFIALAACGGDDATIDKCKASCPEVCPGEGEPTAAEIINCETACDELQATADKRGCDEELGKLFDCADKNACSATLVSACSSQGDAVDDCYEAYCRSHTSDPDC